MASEVAILDTGALVAYLVRSDRYHLWSVATFKKLPAALITCEAVLSETFHLLRREEGGLRALSAMLLRGGIQVVSLAEDLEFVLTLAEKYKNVPMSYADACIVRIAETHPKTVVITTDSDFLSYRMNRNMRIPVMLPRAEK
jgi:predicted nucleic acid-binding protein